MKFATDRPFANVDAAMRKLLELANAMEALILVAKHGGPTMLGRIGVMRALNRHVERGPK
jgi:hypothetical protein